MKMKWNYDTLEIINEHQACSDDVFSALYVSKKTRYRYYQEGHIKINHQVIKQNSPLKRGDCITICALMEEDSMMVQPCFDALHILYEDELFLIVNKPSHMLVHSDGVRSNTTLYDLVKGYYIMHAIHSPVRAIHRLDKETSGAVIFCKIPLLQPLLDQMLKEKQIERRYGAIVSGNLQEKQRRICAPIGRDRHHANKMRVSPTGKEAITDITIIKHYTTYTHIDCKLHQGRTHQIRVHLSSIGYPILHDTLYGKEDTCISRLALHAQQVILFHPLYRKQLMIDCPFPDDIKHLLT